MGSFWNKFACSSESRFAEAMASDAKVEDKEDAEEEFIALRRASFMEYWFSASTKLTESIGLLDLEADPDACELLSLDPVEEVF